MALKPDREERATDVSFFVTSGTLERGVVLIHSTSGSGAAMDQSAASVAAPTGALGNPAGLLLNDVVDIDLTRQHINQHQDEVQTGGKVTLLRQGWVVTDQIVTGISPTAGEKAYWGASGKLTNTQTSDQGSTSTSMGRFLSSKDEDGYVKVEINIV